GSDLHSPERNDPSLYQDVTETHLHPQFNPLQQSQNGHDVAVAILKDATSVTPLALNRMALTPANLGQPVRLVGYGTDFVTSATGTKRVVSTPLTGYDFLYVEFGDATHGVCFGDSGGPAFMTLGGSEVIVGTHAISSSHDCNGTDFSTRVDTLAAPF